MANTSLTTHDTPLHEFYASCPEGFETALADELRGMGLRQVRPLKGRVAFAGSPTDAERACLWSRLASRIFVVLGRFACANAEDLRSNSLHCLGTHPARRRHHRRDRARHQ